MKQQSHNKRVNADILVSFPHWVASLLYPKLHSSQNARYLGCYAKPIMKNVPVLLLAFLSYISFADTEGELLCEGREKRIEPDMQMPETIFNEENSESAKRALEKLDESSEDMMIQFSIENNRRVIEGFSLRSKALSSKNKKDIDEFCDFYINDAFYHD